MLHIPKVRDMREFLLISLFFLSPLLFSQVLTLFGLSSYSLPSGYERYKVYLLVGIICLVSIISWIWYKKYIVVYRRRVAYTLCIMACFLGFWIVGRDNTIKDILVGSFEKHHGVLFYGALAGLFIALKTEVSIEFQERITRWSLYAGIIVCLYAIVQYAGFDPIRGTYHHGTWDTKRIFSSLGNPNYLAGYLLLLFPLISRLSTWRYAVMSLLFVGVTLLTGSIAGVFLGIAYIIWRLLSVKKKYYRVGIMGTGLLILLCFTYYNLPSEKILSISSRFALWKEMIYIVLRDPIILMLGNGPDTIMSYISNQHIVINPFYFNPENKIDSFHNIILDSIFFFGLPLNILFLFFMLKKWKHLADESREGIILFLLFFSVNIAISIHFMFLVFYIAREKGQKKKKSHKKVVSIFDN